MANASNASINYFFHSYTGLRRLDIRGIMFNNPLESEFMPTCPTLTKRTKQEKYNDSQVLCSGGYA